MGVGGDHLHVHDFVLHELLALGLLALWKLQNFHNCSFRTTAWVTVFVFLASRGFPHTIVFLA